MARSAPPFGTLVIPNDNPVDQSRALALVWAGLLLGVSFLATPAKFLSLSLSLPVALDVGRRTFRVLGLVEAPLAALLALGAASSAPGKRRLPALAPCLLMLAQTLWLRPRLDAQTRWVVAGGAPRPGSRLHLAYVACEMAKLAALLAFGLTAAVAPRRLGAGTPVRKSERTPCTLIP